MERLQQNISEYIIYQENHVELGSSERYRSAVLITWPSYNRMDYYDPGISQWGDTRGLLSSLVYIKHHQHNSMLLHCHTLLSLRPSGLCFLPLIHCQTYKRGEVFIDFTSILKKFQYFAPLLLFRWGVLLKCIVNTSLKQKLSGFLISNYLTAWLK